MAAFGWNAGKASTVALSAAMGLCLFACTKTPPAAAPVKATDVDTKPELERYLPLEDGTVFSYEMHSEQHPGQGLLIMQISRPRTGRVDLRTGSRTERLEFVPDGIAYVEGGYLLRLPLTKGSTWKSRTGTVRLESTDETANVPAGKFDGCLRTVEETHEGGLSRTVSSLFCPHVGLVMLDVDGNTPEGHDRQTAVLRSFGPRVDVTTQPMTTTSDD